MSSPDASQQQSGEVSHVVEHLFRHEAGKMVATLTGIFGVEHLTLAEDVVQEALIRALQTWPFHGVPQNPTAWLMRTARNLALDVVRRQQNFREKEPEIIRLMDQPGPGPDAAAITEQEIVDDTLRLMFVCCHPILPAEAQTALALKTLSGFSLPEISRAFLTSEAAIAKRLTRAKQKLRDARIRFELPGGEDLAQRLESVLQTLYLLFNEGYKASHGERLVREEVCQEAIRLTTLLAEHPVGDCPKTHALLALMLLDAARLPARVDEDGNLQRLDAQDRGRWDAALLARGMFHLWRSADGQQLSRYHIEAGIAACHCAAKDFASTDWRKILELYDGLLRFDDSPVIALNRAVAVANVHGPEAGIAAVEAIRKRTELESYYLLYAVLGDFEARRANQTQAARFFRRALALTELPSEQAFLKKRIAACEKEVDPG